MIQEILWKTIEVTGSDTIDSDEDHLCLFSVGRTPLLVSTKIVFTLATSIYRRLSFGVLRDPVLIAFLLAGLNDDYESLRHSVDQSLEKVTSEEVKNRIRDTWARINKRQQDVDSVPGFFGGSYRPPYRGGNSRGRGYNREGRRDRCYRRKK